jgi:hypothetical protein
MSDHDLGSGPRDIRTTDSNSLLRLYDWATQLFNTTNSQLERTRAGKLIQRLTKELQKRQVKL